MKVLHFLFIILVSVIISAGILSQNVLASEVTQWSQVYDNNCYIDGTTHEKMPTYMRVVDKGVSLYDLPIQPSNELKIAWKSDKKIGLNRHIYLYDGDDLLREINGNESVWNPEVIPYKNIPKIAFNYGMSRSTIYISILSDVSTTSSLSNVTPIINETPTINVTPIIDEAPTNGCNSLNLILVKSGDNFERIVNECANCTELVLVDPEYNINATLEIKNRHDIILRSNASSGRSILSTPCLGNESFIKISNSNNILIQNLSLYCSNFEAAIFISNSNNIKIIKNNISITNHGNGIYLESGSDNIVENNYIHNVDAFHEDGPMSVGIKILEAVNSYINNNEIVSENDICHYHIATTRPLNTTIKKFGQIVELRWEDCSCEWDAYFSKCFNGANKSCEEPIPDNDSSAFGWKY